MEDFYGYHEPLLHRDRPTEMALSYFNMDNIEDTSNPGQFIHRSCAEIYPDPATMFQTLGQ